MSSVWTSLAILIGLWMLGLVAFALYAVVRTCLAGWRFRRQYGSFPSPEQDVIPPVPPEYREGYRRWLQKADADAQEQERKRARP